MAGDLHLGLSRFARGERAGAGRRQRHRGRRRHVAWSWPVTSPLAAESAVFTMAYTRKPGWSPDGSSTFYMPRKLGDRRTRELMLTNRVLKAEEARRLGHRQSKW